MPYFRTRQPSTQTLRPRFPRTVHLLAYDHGREKLSQRGPGSLGPLVAVERSFTGSAFAPAFSAVFIDDTHKHNAPLGGAAKTGFKKMNERQTDFAQFDR